MDYAFFVALFVVCALGSAQVESEEHPKAPIYIMDKTDAPKGNLSWPSHHSDPVARGLLKLRPSTEHAINSVDHSKVQPTSESDLGRAHKVESIDFQSDEANLRHNGAPNVDDPSHQPARIEASESAIDRKSLGQPPQAAEPKNASMPVHEAHSAATIAHHEPLPSAYGPPADLVGEPPSGKGHSPMFLAPVPAFGPFPPNYVSDAPVAKLRKPDVRLFLCNFEKHNCGMRNQRNIGRHFNPESSGLGNQPGRYMVVHASHVGYNVSRLITPYLPGYANATACLSVSYIVYGEGADRIEIVAQDTTNRHLFTLEKDGFQWRHFKHAIAVNQDLRFFIEAYTKSRAEGVIAIDNFGFSFAPC